MPRPPSPGWHPKTMSLSAEVIEAVWVLAARTGRSPGKVVNDILAAALLGEPAPAPAPPQAHPSPGRATPPDPAITLLPLVAQPWRTAYGNRIGFFQELSARVGEPLSHRLIADWQAKGRIPDAYVPHIQAMLGADAD
ncbi:hypothetical protein METESE_33180 [Mesoterricola sediminis]|uniref:Uncharacterized protein n=2 Tax=Mesoterricola sediminis TaxID=2927980 RepID=A0AA48H1N3_9BACT|nr:hypothetical protein METESE_33180 [Mesoterricola sediminis]